MICDFCGSEKSRMAIYRHRSGKLLHLCFHDCQHRPGPFMATGFPYDWERVDPWRSIRCQRQKSPDKIDRSID